MYAFSRINKIWPQADEKRHDREGYESYGIESKKILSGACIENGLYGLAYTIMQPQSAFIRVYFYLIVRNFSSNTREKYTKVQIQTLQI